MGHLKHKVVFILFNFSSPLPFYDSNCSGKTKDSRFSIKFTFLHFPWFFFIYKLNLSSKILWTKRNAYKFYEWNEALKMANTSYLYLFTCLLVYLYTPSNYKFIRESTLWLSDLQWLTNHWKLRPHTSSWNVSEVFKAFLSNNKYGDSAKRKMLILLLLILLLL